MRILQLGKFYPVMGGVEKVMYDLMIGLSGRGVECDMMSAELNGSGTMRTIDGRARIHSYHTWAKVASTTIAPSMINALREIAGNYDVIHVHHPDPMAAVALRFSGYKGRVVLHYHSDIIKSDYIVKLYKPLQDWLLHRADVIVGTTPDYIRHSPVLKGYHHKIQCVPIGVSPIVEDRAGSERIRERFGGRKIVFSLGRLIPYKGISYLIEAAALLPDDYVVVIGGDGPLRSGLEEQCNVLGVSDKVRFMGRIADDELSAYFGACDIFCLPSVMKTEAFGIVQIEAMSLGKPVVATKIKGSGTAWVNSHDVSGLNVEPRDAQGLASAIATIGDNQELYARLSNGAMERYNTLFTIDAMIGKCYDLYNSLLER